MDIGFNSYIKEQFNIKEVDIRTYSPLTLAYIGDGISTMSTGKAMQDALRGGIDMAAVGAAAAGGVQMLCREPQKQPRCQQRLSRGVLPQEKTSNDQRKPQSHAGVNGTALPLPGLGGILTGQRGRRL